MSADPDDLMTNQDRLASEDDPSDSASEDGDEPEAAEDLMVVSRSRRSNAGNRMSTLLAQTAEEDQWGDDWEEAPNEEEFIGDDADDQGDFNLDSSSSEDEDEAADEDAGEKALRKAERQQRNKKRKTATNPFAARIAASARKKVKLDVPPTAPSETTPAPRPKKKSERASWIPTPEDGPTRMSSRRQTVISKEVTMARLKTKDKKRESTLAMMKAAEERKEKDRPKPMTQEERLAEAARVEKQNSKSLHRWEEAEERRAAERQAKLDALKNRELEGPFIRYYSGPAIWVDDKIKFTGKDAPKVDELEKRLNSKIALAEAQEVKPELTTSPDVAVETANSQQPSEVPQPSQAQIPHQDDPTDSHSMAYPSSIMFAPPQTSESFLFGIEQYASMQIEPSAQPNPYPLAQNQPNAGTQPAQSQNPQPTQPSQPSQYPSTYSHPSQSTPLPPTHPSQYPPQSQSQSQPSLPPQPPPPPKRKEVSIATRNLVILTSFPSLPSHLPSAPPRNTSLTSTTREKYKPVQIALSQILFSWSQSDASLFASIHSSGKYTTKNSQLPVPPRERCVVSGREARYRDPQTGLCYWGRGELGRVRGLVGGAVGWSREFEVLVGFGGGETVTAAKGVPERFLRGKKEGGGDHKPAVTGGESSKAAAIVAV